MFNEQELKILHGNNAKILMDLVATLSYQDKVSFIDWLQTTYILPPVSTPEKYHGNFSFKVMPSMYLPSLEISNALNGTSKYKIIVVNKSAQRGYSTLLTAVNFYSITIKPTSQLMFFPSLQSVRDWLKTKFLSSWEEMPEMVSLMGAPNKLTTNILSYPRGFLSLSTLAQVAGGQSKPAALIGVDEPSKVPTNIAKAGDTLKNLLNRVKVYGNDYLIIVFGTPGTVEKKGEVINYDSCMVSSLWQKSNQQTFHVQCPKCKELTHFPLTLEECENRLKYTLSINGNLITNSSRVTCHLCGFMIDDELRLHYINNHIMDSRFWLPLNPYSDGEVAGYLDNDFNTTIPLDNITRNFLSSTNPEKRQAFSNLTLAAAYVSGDTDLPLELNTTDKMTTYSGNFDVPASCVILGLGVDVQKDRLECVVVGLDLQDNIYLIDYHVLRGTVKSAIAHSVKNVDENHEDSVWRQLTIFLEKEYLNESGNKHKLIAATIDARDGAMTNMVRSYVAPSNKLLGRLKSRRTNLFAGFGVPYRNNYIVKVINGGKTSYGNELRINTPRIMLDLYDKIKQGKVFVNNKIVERVEPQIGRQSWNEKKKIFVHSSNVRIEVEDCIAYGLASLYTAMEKYNYSHLYTDSNQLPVIRQQVMDYINKNGLSFTRESIDTLTFQDLTSIYVYMLKTLKNNIPDSKQDLDSLVSYINDLVKKD